MRVLTPAQMREAERRTIEDYGVSSLRLMERAGAAVVAAIESHVESRPGRVAVLCGRGNNGGDGWVVARLLQEREWDVFGVLFGRTGDVTGDARANLERVLGQEAGGAVAHVLPVPADGGDGGEDDPLRDLKADIAKAKGSTVLTETTSAGWGEGPGAAPKVDWMPRRIGANPPQALGELREDAWSAVLAACGIPPSLFRDLADGTAQREAFRRFLTTAVQPLAELVAEELAHKLEAPVSFCFEGLYAHDLAGDRKSVV